LTAPVWCHGELSIAYNYTNTEVTKYDSNLLDEQRITLLEKGLPRHRGNLTLSKPITPYWSALGRVNYYGSWDEWSVGHQVFGDAFLVDLESSLSLGNGATITAGIQNILNVEPDNIEEGVNPGPIVGRPFGEYSPYGFGGTFLYAKASYNFNF
ncbi:MAG: TonB-dependent receptor, partial [Gemmatimonadota bacterium]|nr:TonB-dependent receptor [Gemmatimonadota bacterium]